MEPPKKEPTVKATLRTILVVGETFTQTRTVHVYYRLSATSL